MLLETRQIHAQLTPLAERARAQQASAEPPSSLISGSSQGAEGGGADPALAAQLVTLHLYAHRNKRCLLVYHKQRLDWLKARVWDKAGALPLVLDEDVPDAPVASIRPLLSPSELEWLRSYTSLIAMYRDTYLDVLDMALPLSTGPPSSLRDGHIAATGGAAGVAPSSVSVYEALTPANSVRPPEDLLVTVVATRDARSVETERGTMHLRAGERLRVRRDEVEALLIRGWLRMVEE